MNALTSRLYDLLLKVIGARFAAFMATETVMWQQMDEKEIAVKLLALGGSLVAGLVYIWGETVRPSLDKLFKK